MSEKKCKYLSDNFREICVNDDCPVCADFCPVANYPEICKFAEIEGKKRTNADKVRAMTDDELVNLFLRFPCPPNRHGEEDGRSYTECPTDETIHNCRECIQDWLKQEVQNA